MSAELPPGVHWLAGVPGTAIWRKHYCEDGTPKRGHTEDQAREEARVMSATQGEPCDAYPCWCGDWHIGGRWNIVARDGGNA